MAGDNLLQIINDILDLSRVEAGQITLEHIEFDLREQIEKTCEVLAFRAHEKGLELNFHLAPDVPPFLIGDPVRLHQILTNLIGNAIKFTETGEIALFVKRNTIPDKKGMLLFSVTDTGIGIPEEKQSIIFDNFSQADSSTTRQYGGTGLGLAICKRLVELMEGEIWVESIEGKGSTFHFTVTPGIQSIVQKRNKEQLSFTEKPNILIIDDNATNRTISHSMSKNVHPLRILLVEDYFHNRVLIQSYLNETHYALDIAENGKDGLKKFKSGNYDLVLMDIQMPVMDGYTATKEIRKYEKECGAKETPIIALTAHALKGNEQKSLDAGCNHHLVKPIKKQILLDTIHKQVGLSANYHPAEENKEKGTSFSCETEITVDNKLFVSINTVFKKFIPEFIEDVRNDIITITAALHNMDFKTIEMLAHRLKGASGGYGFHELTVMGKAIESSAKNKNTAETQKLINELSRYIEQVEIVYE